MRKKFFIGLALLLASIICSPCYAILIEFDQPIYDVSLGTPFVADLNISGLGDGVAPSLSEFDINVTFDPAILSLTGVTFGDPVLGDQLDLFLLGSLTSATFISPGIENLFELSFDFPSDLDDFQAPAFTLASLSFDTISEGTSWLFPSIVTLGDSFAEPLVAESRRSDAIVGAAPVPEPATIMLMVSGLAGLGVFGRRKFRNSKD